MVAARPYEWCSLPQFAEPYETGDGGGTTTTPLPSAPTSPISARRRESRPRDPVSPAWASVVNRDPDGQWEDMWRYPHATLRSPNLSPRGSSSSSSPPLPSRIP